MERGNKEENENTTEGRENGSFSSKKKGQVDLEGNKAINLVKLLRKRHWASILPNPYHRHLVSLYMDVGNRPKLFNSRLGDIHHIIQQVNPKLTVIGQYDTVIEADKAYESEKAKVRRVFKRHRNIVPEAIGCIIKDDRLEAYVHDGHSLEECWPLIDTTLGRHGIIPILSDRRDYHKYKLIDIISFIKHWEFLVHCGLSTIKNVAKAVEASDRSLDGRISQKLIKQIAEDNEHLVIDYPRRYTCRFCKEILMGEDALEDHMQTCKQRRF